MSGLVRPDRSRDQGVGLGEVFGVRGVARLRSPLDRIEQNPAHFLLAGRSVVGIGVAAFGAFPLAAHDRNLTAYPSRTIQALNARR